MKSLSTPVVLIIFNRPEKTKRVLEQIKKVQPSKLFVISDGPRPNNAQDPGQILLCRRLIAEISWPCVIYQKYSAKNLGCKANISLGLNWVFDNVTEAIILEDDCVPNESFFHFCEETLELYRNKVQVGSISGSNLEVKNLERTSISHVFSKYPSVWGWATWSRVWKEYEVNIGYRPRMIFRDLISQNTRSRGAKRYWRFAFYLVSKKGYDTWDYQLTFLHWRLNLLSVIPTVNLITNIGFDKTSTHTRNDKQGLLSPSTSLLTWPFSFPDEISVNEEYDNSVESNQHQLGRFGFLLRVLFFSLPKTWQRAIRSKF